MLRPSWSSTHTGRLIFLINANTCLRSFLQKNEALLEKLQEAEDQVKEQEVKNADAAAAASELEGKIQALKDELTDLEEVEIFVLSRL